MAVISAALVRELRERTGAPMMDCKKALEESDGVIEKAIEALRKSGRIKADKKAGRTAAEGIIAIASNDARTVMLEMNCETDFVARDASFLGYAQGVIKTALASAIDDVDALAKEVMIDGDGKTIQEARQELVAKVGENVQIRRIALMQKTDETVATYLHGNRIGVMVALDIANPELARDIAMHIAASKPLVVQRDQVSQALLAKEKEIYTALAASSGKPADIIEKMVAGRLEKFLDEVSLVGQPFVKDADITVGQLLDRHHARVIEFYRFEVGEGIEKVTEDFKAAVMSQIQGS